jgi:manganese/iron transport system permease protein/iron/zinc/copper transport system permease protein
VSWLIDPLRDYEFFRNAVLAGVLGGGLCGLVGVYVVLRRMSYIGHGLSHAIFGGAVASYLLDVNFYLGAGAWGLGAALLINALGRRRRIGADAAIGIVTTASFALGVALISSTDRLEVNLDAALFGNILGVSGGDLLVLALVAAGAGTIVFTRYRPLLFATFDPDVAEAHGVNVRRLDVLFSLVLAATVVATMRVLGVTLIAAMIVIPAISARLLTDSFGRMLGISTLVGALCGLVGMYLSFYLGPASGATIVLVATAAFTVLYLGTAAVDRRKLARLEARAGVEPVGGPAPELRQG